MRNYFTKYIVSAAVLLTLLSGCQDIMEEPVIEKKQQTNASLVLDIDLPKGDAATKSISTDPLNNGGTWSEWEKFADASLLYNVTLFVIKEDGRLVGYRKIQAGSSDVNSENGFYASNSVNTTASSGTSIKVTFPADNPLHGNVELLSAGNYTLLAVANYAPVESGKEVYQGLGKMAEDGSGNYNGAGDFNGIVDRILASFSSTSGVAGFTAANYPEFFGYRLDAGNDRVCKVLPQPLVMIRNITLEEGNNNITGELSRTFARIRLEVINKNSETFLDISSLAFKGAYASKSAYLFNDVASAGDNMYGNFSLYDGNASAADNTRGVLDVTSDDAIITAPGTDARRILAGATETIFDAYILEGRIESSDKYAFTFNAAYTTKMADGDATGNCMIASFFSDYKYSSGSSGSHFNRAYGIIDDSFYLFIRSNTSNVSTCLKADVAQGKIVVQNSGAGNEDRGKFTLAPEYIWEMVIPGGEDDVTVVNSGGMWGNTYVQYAPGYLKSLSSHLYLQPYDGTTTDLILDDEPGDVIFKMDFSGEDEHGTVFCKYNGKYYYINSTQCKWTGPVNNMDDYKKLTYETIIASPVESKEETISCLLQMKNSSGNIVRKDEIVRNDFFHGVIPISLKTD